MGAQEIQQLNDIMDVNPGNQHGLRFDNVIELVNEQRATIVELVTLANELKADLNLITTKLDADTGITDTDYSSLHTVAAADGTALTVAAVTRI